MGGVSSNTKKSSFLKQEEVDLVAANNKTLESLYNKYKDTNGNITEKELEKILEKKIDTKIIKKLFKIFVSPYNDKFTYENFKIFFAIYRTHKPEAKINFISETLFSQKSHITQEKYIKRVNFFYSKAKDLLDILMNKEFMNSLLSNNSVLKENFVRNSIKKNRSFFTNFSFLKENFTPIENYMNILDINENNTNIINNTNNPTGREDNKSNSDKDNNNKVEDGNKNLNTVSRSKKQEKAFLSKIDSHDIKAALDQAKINFKNANFCECMEILANKILKKSDKESIAENEEVIFLKNNKTKKDFFEIIIN